MNNYSDSPVTRSRTRAAATRTSFTSSTPISCGLQRLNIISYKELETNLTCLRTANKIEGSIKKNKSIQEVRSGLLDATMTDEDIKYEDIVEEAGILIEECQTIVRPDMSDDMRELQLKSIHSMLTDLKPARSYFKRKDLDMFHKVNEYRGTLMRNLEELNIAPTNHFNNSGICTGSSTTGAPNPVVEKMISKKSSDLIDTVEKQIIDVDSICAKFNDSDAEIKDVETQS